VNAALAERVDPARVRRARRQHLADDEVDVRVGVVGVLGRHHVRAEEGDLVGDLAGEPHEALLIGDREAVARLDFERRGALRVQLGDERGEPGPQLVVGRRSRGGDGRADAAGLVAPARHARGELLGAVAAEHEVRVAVDEPGDHRAAAHVDDLDVGVPERAVLLRLAAVLAFVASCEVLGRVRGGADPRDATVLDEHGGIADDAERSALAV